MAGIYIHIPLCATRCIYCDFYSTTLRGQAPALVEALVREMDQRRDFLSEPVRTVYLGGGTPSQLGPDLIARLLDALAARFDLSLCEEVTMEANPEDIAHGPAWHWGRINRVSMGVQSMVDAELRLLHRRHNAAAVRLAVSRLRQGGIRNISLDLMYGLPGQTLQSWDASIEQVLALHPQHLSAYNLMVEEGTQLHRLVERGELTPCDDETCLQMAQLLRQRLHDAGLEQYEISNYARPGYHSSHNSSYWTPTPYLGLGPGAHSYDGQRLRISNAPDLTSYLAGRRHEEREELTDLNLYNERIMLGLRTRLGVALSDVMHAGLLRSPRETQALIDRLTARRLLTLRADHLTLTESGLALADEVMRELMV